VRLARPTDLPGLTALLDRCTPETLYRRFHGVVGSAARKELERIATPTPTHRSWVAVAPDGDIRGKATLAWGRGGDVEIAFLVEDGHRREGIGRALVTAAGREAARRGVTAIDARIQGDNVAARRFLDAVVPGVATRFEDGLTVATIGPASRASATTPAARPEAA
jgi:GNAT superfamily N-acetyltransferase